MSTRTANLIIGVLALTTITLMAISIAAHNPVAITLSSVGILGTIALFAVDRHLR